MLDEIRNEHGERLDFTFRPGERQLVVIGHGVTANKDRPWALTIAEALETAGHATLRLSFSGNGGSEGKFEDSTISKEVADLGSVFDALENAGNNEVCYVGHSMGAAVGVLRASRDPRIRKLVSLGGMVDTADFCQRKFGALNPGEFMWDKPECPLSQAFIDDLHGIGTTAPRGAEITIPWLLVHGTADDVVPIRDSETIAEHAPHARLVALEDADHVFTGAAAHQCATFITDWLRTL